MIVICLCLLAHNLTSQGAKLRNIYFTTKVRYISEFEDTPKILFSKLTWHTEPSLALFCRNAQGLRLHVLHSVSQTRL